MNSLELFEIYHKENKDKTRKEMEKKRDKEAAKKALEAKGKIEKQEPVKSNQIILFLNF